MRRMNFTDTQVATSETARGINRGIVLNLIRRRQPISRADLARASVLLASRANARGITGAIVTVDAGVTLRMPRRP